MAPCNVLMRVGRLITLVIAAGVVCVGCGSKPDEAIRTLTVFDLLKAFPRSAVQSPGPEYVQLSDVDLVGDRRPAIFMHPPSSAEFPAVEVTAESALFFGIGIQSDAWDKAGDGVEFHVTLRTANNARGNLFSRYIDPKHNSADRRWMNVRIPLQQFAGQKVQITLATSPGPAGNTDNDWSAWSEPQIVLRRR